MAEEGNEVTLFQPKVEAETPEMCSHGHLAELKHLEVASVDFSGDSVSPERINVHDYGDDCFLLQGLLSASEAKYYIDSGERLGFEPIRGAADSYRNMTRLIVESGSLAELLWERVHPFLTDIELGSDPHKSHIHGARFLLEGHWKPCGINNVMRLCKYPAEGHFAPHFDGYYVKSAKVRTMKTLMLYLNADFEAGHTHFIDESQLLYQDCATGRYCAEEKNILCRVKPEAGLGILFNHHILHEGQATRNGLKYILRTDVLYEQADGPAMTESDKAALILVQDAERLEAEGRCMEAMQKYRKAFKISPSLEEAYGN